MNDILDSKLQEMKDQVKAWWDKLSDDDLEQASSNAEQLIGLIHQKYGYTLEHVEAEFNKRIKGVEEMAAEEREKAVDAAKA